MPEKLSATSASSTNANTNATPNAGVIAAGFWSVCLLAHLLASLWLAWALLAKVDFAYALGYGLIDSQAHIAHYAPQNLYKQGFGETSPAEHIELFGQINQAVHNHGAGLADIRYTRADGSRETLLHQDERVHLQDVANLIDVIYGVGILSLLLWLACLAYARHHQWPMPAPRPVAIGFATGALVLMCAVLLIGPTAVFYWAHTLVFPPDHPWFFYYEESLMTTLMKAPDIFAFIAVLLVTLALLIWCVGFVLMQKLLPTRMR